MKPKIPLILLEPFSPLCHPNVCRAFQRAANESAGSPVSDLFLKRATYFEFSSLSPAPDWLLRFQSGTEETFKHAAPLLCLPGSAQSRNQPCNSAQVRPHSTTPVAATLHLTGFPLQAPQLTPCLLAAQRRGESKTLPCPGKAEARGEQLAHGCCFALVQLTPAAFPG